ncbi:MAG: D-alanyl-D-alanine carboxypeptidase [bacterium]|nr:D-alanyl-D-alanine carboxypeptidase [bacterium]
MDSFQKRRVFSERNGYLGRRKRKRVLHVLLIALFLVVLSGTFVGYKMLTKKPSQKMDNQMMTNLATASPAATDSAVKEQDADKTSEEASVEAAAQVNPKLALVTKDLKKNAKNISSKYACLVSSNGDVVYSKDADKKMNPASMTKLMTALVIVNNVTDFNKKATIAQDTINFTLTQNASVAGFEVGEKAKLIDLLYGVLLPSGAECCITLGQYVAGSDQAFVDLMNEKAKEIGMTNTHFMNSTGLTEKNHYSSAKDMAILLQKCMENEQIKKILSEKKHDVGKTNIHKKGFTFYSTVYPKFSKLDMQGITLLGGKTGYTDEAGFCLASAATINKETYFFVSAGGTGSKTVSANDAQYVYKTVSDIINQ